jgi:hypothetical protein
MLSLRLQSELNTASPIPRCRRRLPQLLLQLFLLTPIWNQDGILEVLACDTAEVLPARMMHSGVLTDTARSLTFSHPQRSSPVRERIRKRPKGAGQINGRGRFSFPNAPFGLWTKSFWAHGHVISFQKRGLFYQYHRLASRFPERTTGDRRQKHFCLSHNPNGRHARTNTPIPDLRQ